MESPSVSSACSYCKGSLASNALYGRECEGHSCAAYCCSGCLYLGETATSSNANGLGLRLAVGILIVGQSMIFGLSLNLHDDVPESMRWWAQTILMLGTLLVAGLLGFPMFLAAWQAMRRREVSIEMLFIITMLGAFIASLQSHLSRRGHVYFEVVSVLLVVYTLGKLISSRVRSGAINRSRRWLTQLAQCRRIDDKGSQEFVSVSEIEIGNRVEVWPGELVPVDGIILSGSGLLSEADVTGEIYPQKKGPGDHVLTGVQLRDSVLQIEATSLGRARQVDRLVEAIESAQLRPFAFAKQTEQLTRLFFPVVASTAIGTFIYWATFGNQGFESGLFNAMSVLLVACPCALGLASPMVTWSTIGKLAERGLIVHTSDAIEKLASVDRVILDKTGTLSENQLRITSFNVIGDKFDHSRLLSWVALVEAQSDHPLARPFAELVPTAQCAGNARLIDFVIEPGRGVRGKIEESSGSSHVIQIGDPRWFEKSTHERIVDVNESSEGRRIAVYVDGEIAGIAILVERFRDSVTDMFQGFAALNLPVEILTGDSTEPSPSRIFAPTLTGLLPTDKLAHVEEIMANGGHPLVVGDGINDAAILARGQVGIALASGTDLAIEAAPISLYHGNLRAIPWAIQTCRDAVQTIRGYLLRAVVYNLIGMTIAAFGLLHPVLAVVLMGISSLSLIFSASRLSNHNHCEEIGKQSNLSNERWKLSISFVRAGLHAVALIAQILVITWFFSFEEETAIVITALGCVCALMLSVLWCCWSSLPHTLDMIFGMVTLGNFGMLFGAWADRDFSANWTLECCCQDLNSAGMWVGMLIGSNLAMLWLGRRPLDFGTDHVRSMFTAGNIGMAIGMMIGGVYGKHLPFAFPRGFLELLGMSIGMIVGMLAGTRIAEVLIALCRSVPTDTNARSSTLPG